MGDRQKIQKDGQTENGLSPAAGCGFCEQRHQWDPTVRLSLRFRAEGM
jgi:hypothetical protein